MEIRYSADDVRYQRMDTDELRASFLVSNLFREDEVTLLYSDIDRVIVGSASPMKQKLALSAVEELAAEYFTQRRELGVINVGGRGKITVDGRDFHMENRDGLYIGRFSCKYAVWWRPQGSSPTSCAICRQPSIVTTAQDCHCRWK